MKLEKLVGDRFRERPSDCIIDSHALMVRGGYMKYVANGIFSSYMPLKRITRKIERLSAKKWTLLTGRKSSFLLSCRLLSGRNLADTIALVKKWPASMTVVEVLLCSV